MNRHTELPPLDREPTLVRRISMTMNGRLNTGSSNDTHASSSQVSSDVGLAFLHIHCAQWFLDLSTEPSTIRYADVILNLNNMLKCTITEQ